MAKLRPWGKIEVIFDSFGRRGWHCIACASFEERAAAVPTWLSHKAVLERTTALVLNPPADAGTIKVCRDEIGKSLHSISALGPTEACAAELLGPMSAVIEIVAALPEGSSVVLDITSMPKRYFMFMVMRLMDSPAVSDLIVTYTRPSRYPEGVLASDPEPASSLQGLSRNGDVGIGSTMIVGVGYIQFSLSELMEKARGAELKFLMPFPPGSPSARRNWRLLQQMDPNVETSSEIRRVHSMDTFEAYDWIREALGRRSPDTVELFPMGPKPHSLAMALAYRSDPEKFQVQYAQPHTYRPDYSIGVGSDEQGRLDAYGYCLRRSGVDYI
ncbi:hypothetical protein AB8E26_05630 [Stenotrophomonas rhizophila]|uniref:hypothetical protein n=1 Tax=Stenotrophomonas rhizophila TaxID=216778 RepID=UPI0035152FA6